MSTIAPPPKPTNPVLVDSEGYIDQQIRRTRRSLKLLDLAAGTLTLLIGLLAFVLVGALIDHWIVPGGLSDGGRLALFGVMLAGVAWYGWKQFVPLLKPINPVYAAQTIERNTPTLKNSLLNLLLFRSHRNYLSARVYHALEQQTAVKLSSSGVDGSLDRSALLRLGYVLLGVIAVCAIYAVLSPKSLALSTLRVINPLLDIAAPSRVQIQDVKPGKTSVARGERVEVSAEIHGLSADEPVRLRYSTADETTVDESIRMERPAVESRRFEAALPRGTDAGVEQDLTYWIEAGDARSRKFKLTVFTRPTLIVQKIHYAYPPYTGLPTKETNHVGDIRGVEGTKVTIGALASQPIKNAYVDFDADGTSDLPMKTDGDRAMVTIPLELREDRRTPVHPKYALRFTAEDGRQNADPPVYSIEVTPDYAPEVSITEPQEPEQVARLGDVIPIGIEALDPDYGLKSVAIVGKVDDADAVPLLEMINEPQTGRTVATKLFTPGDADLKPGDVLEYWAVALDGRPVPNIGLSEHRRLKIIGPDKPQQGNQQQQPNQGAEQPNDGQQGGENGESGQGGASGQGGESSDSGGEGEQQAGAGGSSGEGKEGESGQESDQGQDGAGGGGGGNKSGDSKEESDQAGENGGGSSGSEGEQSEGDAPQGSGGGASGQKQQPQEGQSPSEQGGESGESGGQDSGEAGGAGGKVSPEGDDDATALQRIMEDWNKKNPQQNGAGKPGEQQPGGEQQAGGEQQPGEAGQPGEQNGETPQGSEAPQQQNGQGGEQQPNQGSAGKQDGAQQQAGANGEQPKEGKAGEGEQMNGGEQQGQPPNGSPQSKNAAGQGQQGSGQQPQAEGAQPQGPGEQGGDEQQSGGAAGENPSKREGASQAREPKPGDGQTKDEQQGEKASPDSAMNKNDGDSGAGHSTGEEQGSPGNDDAMSQGKKKNQQDNRPGNDDKEAPSGSADKKESDSQGGPSGDQSGGGQEGAGQQADAAGKGGPGEHEAADEGAGRAQEQGEGETGTNAGDQQKADGQTGQSSGDQAGNGSQQGEAGESGAQQPGEAGSEQDQAGTQKPPGEQPEGGQQGSSQVKPGEQGSDGPQGQPGGEQQQPAGGEQGAEGGEKPAGSDAQGEQGQQLGGEAAGQQPPSGSPDAQPPSDQQNNQQPSDKPSNQNAAGSAQPMGGGTGSNAQSSSSAESGQLGADKANLDYARQQTNLVLEGLDQQLTKKQVDRELLKNLGWTEAELRQFIDRWKNLKDRAAGQGEDAVDAKQELDETLGSLGIRKNEPLRFQGKAKADDLRANDALRVKPPSEYADRVREYTKGISSQRKN
jgi:hypothetical protein